MGSSYHEAKIFEISMTESTMSFFINLAVICGVCVGLLKVAGSSHSSSSTNLSDIFITFFFFDK
jgi:hypothetical protein